MNFTGRINAFRVIERLERLNILGGQNTESVKMNRILKLVIYHNIALYTNLKNKIEILETKIINNDSYFKILVKFNYFHV